MLTEEDAHLLGRVNLAGATAFLAGLGWSLGRFRWHRGWEILEATSTAGDRLNTSVQEESR